MYQRKHLLQGLGAISVMAAFCFAADEPKVATPKSPAALAAIARHERAVADAAQEYELTKQKAREILLVDLKKAQADALKVGGPSALSEANAIQAIIDRPAPEPRIPPAPGRMAFIGKKYKWTDPQFGNRGWFKLNDDNTVAAGWHEREGVWGVRADGMIVAGIQGNGGKMILRQSADGKSLVWALNGKPVELMN